MNKKLKCLLSAVLVVIMLASAAIAMPATAAKSTDADAVKTGTVAEAVAVVSDAADTIAAETADDGCDVFTDGNNDLEEINNPDEGSLLKAKDSIELAETGQGGSSPDLTTDLNVFRKGSYGTRIVLKWRKVSGVDGYRVYWRNMLKKNAPSKKLTTVKNRTVTVSNLKRGAKYRFTVRAYYKKNGKIVLGKASSVTAATIPPQVKGLRLKSAASKATVIKWAKTANIDGYVLLRQYQGEWSTYKYLSPNATQFRDTKVTPGHTYCYKLIAYRKDTRGYQNTKSEILPVVCGLCAPADTGSTSRGNRVNLSWRDIPYATGYLVSYSTDNKSYKGLADTKNNSATSKKFPEGTKVYFRIQPYRIVGSKHIRVLGTVSQFTVKVLANSFGADVGDTYVEIDISDQHLWFIKKGEVVVSTPVVTGNYNSMDTPKGIYSIRDKCRNVSLVGAGYVSFVEYWMPFIGSSYGIHDASWRSDFGGSIFKGNGSHGCVNTPYNAVKTIYNNISVGTPVVIHA